MDKKIKSHIQLAKGHMGPFSFIEGNRKMVYYLDLNYKSITTRDIKNINVIEGYYSNEIEKKLNKNIESKFFSFRNEMIKMTEGKKVILFDEEKHDWVINYLDALFLRSNFVLKEYNKNSLISPILGNVSHNFLLEYRFDNSEYVSMFKDYRVISIYNRTKINFVLPALGFYAISKRFNDISNSGGYHYLLPITPNIAFLLIEKSNYEVYLNAHNFNVCIDLVNDDDILFLNKSAFDFEEGINNKFLISKTLKELKIIISHIK